MLRQLDRLLSLPFRGLIRGYQIVISPVLHALLGPFGGCRFQPSCSQYALEAYQKHHVFRATWLMVWRILRCNPLFKGGYDPVPERREP